VKFSSSQVQKIRFSQESCSETTKTGQLVDNVALSMKNSGFKKEHAIEVVLMPDGIYTSMDNRRLVAAKQAIDIHRASLTVFVNAHKHDDAVDMLLYEIEYEAFNKLLAKESKKSQKKWRVNPEGISKHTWGELIILRMKSGYEGNYDVTGKEKYGYNHITQR